MKFTSNALVLVSLLFSATAFAVENKPEHKDLWPEKRAIAVPEHKDLRPEKRAINVPENKDVAVDKRAPRIAEYPGDLENEAARKRDLDATEKPAAKENIYKEAMYPPEYESDNRGAQQKDPSGGATPARRLRYAARDNNVGSSDDCDETGNYREHFV